jgi:hypothetical protein
MTESWAQWNPPPYPYHVSYQPVNFLIDLAFYAVLLQIPMQLYLRSRKKGHTRAEKDYEKSVFDG